MRIPLDPSLKIPIYRQISNYFRELIMDGRILPETRLPAMRELAKDLGINRLTVENAYSELEAEGLVDSRIGSGTYVLPPLADMRAQTRPDESAWPSWQDDLTAPSNQTPLPMLDSMMHASADSGTINFAYGGGDARTFPVDEFRKVLQRVIRRDGLAALEYEDPRGYAPLRRTIARVLSRQGLAAREEDVLVTSGSQQAIALAAELIFAPEDIVFVEEPTYTGALDLFRSLRLKIIGVPMDEDGMRVDQLEALVRLHGSHPLYTIPNFHNPTGACLSGARRRQLVKLAERYGFPILEDDFVGDLRYEGHAQPTLKSLDPGGFVIYISTFSKMLMPGLRVGFLLAEGPIFERLVRLRRMHDLATSSLSQRALEAFVTVGRYQAHLRRTCQRYRLRRDALLDAMRKNLPGDFRYRPVHGGLFQWINLPQGMQSSLLLQEAQKLGVHFAPGGIFFQNSIEGESFLRLNFCAIDQEAIHLGLQRLGEASQQLRER
jgi:GntR family transcriptional regulator / MocR family aminotransferase